MQLTKHLGPHGTRWALDGHFLPEDFTLSRLLRGSREEIMRELETAPRGDSVESEALAPIEETQEVWASGVTYLSSRMAREAESQTKDVYQKVYHAERPELFFKAIGWRVRGPGQSIRIREDSDWNVPEPELTLVINSRGEILGYTVGNDVSSRSIEGENPLYLPQAKIYNQSAAIGPALQITGLDSFPQLPIDLQIERDGENGV